MASYQIANLLEKMMSNDKDFRFMATNDLMVELQKDSIKLDDESEKKVCRMVLKLLEDKNGEVQNLAVKCLGPLVNKVKEPQVGTIVDCLCTNMIAPNNEHLRDISSIGLKIVISELPQTSTTLAPLICERITDKLNKTIEKENVSVQLEALDMLSDLLSRFSDYMLPHHEKILIALVPQLQSQRQAIRKRTIVALSHLLTSCNDHQYNEVIVHLSNGLRKPDHPGVHRTYIQCLASICRQSGHRLSRHIDGLMELLKKYSADDDDELREFCLQACEAFVYRCPEAIVRHIPDIVNLCLTYITYDPNYNYEADDGEGASMDTEDDEEVDSEEFSDDDDMSWKVRRSAAKCLEAVIATRRELLEDFYRTLSPALIARFKEREENVKSDIFHAYIALLRATRPAETEISSNNPDSMDQIPVPISLLNDQIPTIVRAIQPLMREKSVKTRQDCFLLLKELLTASPGALANYVDALIPGITYSLCDKNSTSNIKIDALGFVYTLFISHNPQAFHRHISVLVPLIETAVGDTFYKIATEALLVLQQLVKVIRPLDIQVNFEFAPFVGNLYHCTLNKLGTPEVDQEVRERAIACMGQIIANMGDVLQPELVVCLPIFMDRLRNDVTRLSAVKALTMIAASPLRVDLSPIMDDVIPALGSFLRKNYRALKLHSLTLLDTLILNYSSFIAPQLLQLAIAEVPPLVSDSDLHVAQLSLVLLTSSAKYRPEALIKDSEHILGKTLKLLESPLLQGAALTCMMKFLKTLVEADLPGLYYRNVLVRLTGLVQNARSPLHKQVFHSVARCIAAITEQTPNEAISVAKEFMGVIQNPQNDNHLVFCLLTIGEIGRHFNLSHIDVLPQFILKCFGAASEDVRGAASHALGAVAVGNLSFYLPLILREIEAQPKRQYLLLNSIKELISSLSTTQSGLDQLLPSVPQIWMQLFKYCECSEEGSRNVVAECLGKLVIVQPEQLLPQLQAALSNRSPLMRTAAVTAIKFTISDQPQAIDYLLKQCIRQFLLALKDTEPSVRRVALVAFNSAVHNKPALVRDLLPELLPLLYEETKPKKELIREVEMGPFKHTVDDGLDIRKAAFECMYTLLEQGLDRVDIILFLEHVQIGLNDHYDIKMLTYLMTARLAHLCPSHVLQHLDQFVDPLRATCTLKVKANSVKQEHEKQDELKRSALRAVVALLQIPEADKNQHLSEFLQFIKTSSELQPLFETVQKDNNATNNTTTDAAPLTDKNSQYYMV